MEYSYFNPNPTKKNVGDCAVRAISKAFNQNWEQAYTNLILEGFILHDMPSANAVWGSYLKKNGYSRKIISNVCSDCYTLADFARDNSKGTYIVALSGHVVCVKDGTIYDSWDSRNELPLYFWYKEE